MKTVAAPKKKNEKSYTITIEAPKQRINPQLLQMMAARSGQHVKRISRSNERRQARKDQGY